MKTNPKLFCATIALLCIASNGFAAKLFALDVAWNAGADTVQVENSSLPNLIKELIDKSGNLSVVTGDSYSGSLRYFGMPDALVIDVDVPSLTLRLTSAVTGLDVTITGTDKDDLHKKLANWFYLDGGKAAALLLSEAIKTSAAAITDGSPGSTTALMADTTFQTFGLFQNTSRGQNMRGFESGAHVGLWVNSSSYEIDTPVGPMEGTRTRINVPLWLHFGTRVSFVGNTVFDFNSLEGTDFYGVGADIGLAFRPVLRVGDDRFGWQVTPYGGAHGIGSVDGVTAAAISQYGLINRFEWRLFERALLSVVTQYTSFDNVTIKIDEYELTAPVDQNILKNGLMYDVPVFSLRSLFANAYVIDTRFLEEAKTDNYQTYGGGLSYRLKKFSLNAYVSFDKSDQHQGLNTGLGFVWDL